MHVACGGATTLRSSVSYRRAVVPRIGYGTADLCGEMWDFGEPSVTVVTEASTVADSERSRSIM